MKKLQRLAVDCQNVEKLSARIGRSHPFIAAQEPRLLRVRNTILLDLSTALKQAVAAGEEGKTQLVKILSIYRDFKAGEEAVKILKDVKRV